MTTETNPSTVRVTADARPERRLIRPSGSFRHVDFAIRVSEPTDRRPTDRQPVAVALVLDRSGSMHGDKIETAKRAALAVLDRLDERDELAVVIFDDRIDVLQPAAAATPELKARVRVALAGVQARANTALHEGWLTGCQAIAGGGSGRDRESLARCFLLTDGLANVGLTDTEQIAAEAGQVREKTGIGTSTFGIGPDYDEALLGPLAVAGSGQFHHLRTTADLGNTFVGELGELLSVAAARVRLEIEATPRVTIDVVSQYHSRAIPNGVPRWTVDIGDLLAGEERHVVARFQFPGRREQESHAVRARVVWVADGEERSTDWQEVRFTYAEHRDCDAEAREPAVMRWVGTHHADRARRDASVLARKGDLSAARTVLEKVARYIEGYANGDPVLLDALAQLRAMRDQLREVAASPMMAKEAYYAAQLGSRAQRDHRA